MIFQLRALYFSTYLLISLILGRHGKHFVSVFSQSYLGFDSILVLIIFADKMTISTPSPITYNRDLIDLYATSFEVEPNIPCRDTCEQTCELRIHCHTDMLFSMEPGFPQLPEDSFKIRIVIPYSTSTSYNVISNRAVDNMLQKGIPHVPPRLPFILVILTRICVTAYTVCIQILHGSSNAFMMYVEWANRILKYVFNNLEHIYIFSRPTPMLIRRLCVYSRRNHMRRHDFELLRMNFNKPTCLILPLIFLFYYLMYCPTASGVNVNNHIVSVRQPQNITAMIPGPTPFAFSLNDINPTASTLPRHFNTPHQYAGIKGGGRISSQFSAQELDAFAISHSNICSGANYKFHLHGPSSVLENQKYDGDVVMCKIPLSHIAERLSRISLLSIAKQHSVGITTRSSNQKWFRNFMRHREISVLTVLQFLSK